MKVTTLGLIVKDGKILLGMKKRGFGVGLWNGFGGKVEAGESLEENMIREFKEETDLDVLKIRYRGFSHFAGVDKDDIRVNYFEILEYEGEPKESEEMRPEWFDLSEIPYGEMWEDDKYWLPVYLEGRSFEAYFDYQEGKVASHSIKLIS